MSRSTCVRLGSSGLSSESLFNCLFIYVDAQALIATKDEEELEWLRKEIRWKLGPVADVEYRTRIEAALTSLRSTPPPSKP